MLYDLDVLEYVIYDLGCGVQLLDFKLLYSEVVIFMRINYP